MEAFFFISISITQDVFVCMQLLKQGNGDDQQLSAAWVEIGVSCTERGEWNKAAQYFKQAKDLGMMAECYYRCVLLFRRNEVRTRGSFSFSIQLSL